RLPGVTSSDMSARFGVRGAPLEEVYSTLDGLELDEPFHLKDIDAALSIIDVSSIAGVDLITGGFSAEYGNRLTGVFSMHSVEPEPGRTRQAASLSIMNARYTIESGDRDGRHGWYASVRRGYLDLALKLGGYSDSLSPGYGDVFAKYFVKTRAGRFAAHTLISGDHLNYFDTPNNHLLSSYANRYVWGTWTGSVGALRQTTVATWGDLLWRRNGDIRDRGGRQTMSLADRKNFRTARLRQDWQAEWTPRFLTRAGFAVSSGLASYDYDSWQLHQVVQGGAFVETSDTIAVAESPSGNTAGGYVSQRVRLASRLIMEAGLRYDHGSYVQGSAHADPRLSLAWDATPSTSVRAAWGRYSQFQPLHGLHPGDRDMTFAAPERAEHRTFGVEQRLPGYVSARVELYERRLTDPRVRFVNLSNTLDVFSELGDDRGGLHPTSGTARGVETIVQRSGVGRTDWSLTYALASIRDRFGVLDLPRSTDQRHTLTADWAFHPVSNKWRMSVAWTMRSGFPITSQSFSLDSVGTGQNKSYVVTRDFGAPYSERLPQYQRADARFTRYWDTSRGQLALYTDVFNLLGRANPRAYDYDVYFNPFRSAIGYDTYLPRFPSLGLSWTF
ncbi:MAG TPA: TonB-dependent receptor, partial [Gemmatimonadaceae bacterium]|nr:TonB-dependent receptor [Gemmatimonadaceae bacterium]